MRVEDLGERRLVDEVFAKRYAGSTINFGDDVALFDSMRSTSGFVVGTTDPCPFPASSLVGKYSYYSHGYLLGTINLSDLAAGGAQPLGLLVSIELPSDLPVSSLNEFLDGLDDCCLAAGTGVKGGNVRESRELRATGFAVGYLDGPPLSRSTAEAGDQLVVLGSMGLAWSCVLGIQHELRMPDVDRQRTEGVLVTPRPLVSLGRRLHAQRMLSACTDSSDGVDPAIHSIAAASGLRARINLDQVPYDRAVLDVAESLDIHPWAIARTWGDWSLVATVPESHLDELTVVAKEEGTDVAVIGDVTDGSGVDWVKAGRTGRMNLLESEHFVRRDRPFLEWYSQAILTCPIGAGAFNA